MAYSESIPTVQVAPGNRNKKLKFIVGGLMIALAIGYLMYTGIQSNATYFMTIDELYAEGSTMENQTVRVSGWVDTETIQFDNRNLVLEFDVTSDNGERLAVVFNGPKPDQMRAGTEAIIEGKYDGNSFEAQNLLLKCPSKYEGEPEEVQVQALP